MVFIDINDKIRSNLYWIVSKDKVIYKRAILALKDKKMQKRPHVDGDIYVS
jgi:hypothetical protein